MKRIIAIFAFGLLSLAALTTYSISQDGEKAKGYLPPGWKSLNLTQTQKEKIYTIQKDFRAKYQELEEMKLKLKAEEKSELVKVLTEDQKKLLAKIALGEGPSKK